MKYEMRFHLELASGLTLIAVNQTDADLPQARELFVSILEELDEQGINVLSYSMRDLVETSTEFFCQHIAL